MKIKDIIDAIEKFAPLRLQEDYDNSGLQVGFPSKDLTGVLVCLDVTPEIIEEAAAKGCNLIVSHHPLLFRGLKCVSDATWQQRCTVNALHRGIAVYSAHTNLDNARGGVNFKIAEKLGLKDLEWLDRRAGEDAGSGLVGTLSEPEEASAFIRRVKGIFGVECLRHTRCAGKTVKRVALCGGAGSFLLGEALRKGADCFITGEFHYHDLFDSEGMLLLELGHWQSEQFTVELLKDLLAAAFPGAKILATSVKTDPAEWTCE